MPKIMDSIEMINKKELEDMPEMKLVIKELREAKKSVDIMCKAFYTEIILKSGEINSRERQENSNIAINILDKERECIAKMWNISKYVPEEFMKSSVIYKNSNGTKGNIEFNLVILSKCNLCKIGKIQEVADKYRYIISPISTINLNDILSNVEEEKRKDVSQEITEFMMLVADTNKNEKGKVYIMMPYHLYSPYTEMSKAEPEKKYIPKDLESLFNIYGQFILSQTSLSRKIIAEGNKDLIDTYNKSLKDLDGIIQEIKKKFCPTEMQEDLNEILVFRTDSIVDISNPCESDSIVQLGINFSL